MSYQKGRHYSFAIQSQVLMQIAKRLLAFGRKSPAVPILSRDQLALLNAEVSGLFRQDIADIRAGYYPVSVLKPKGASELIRLWPKVIWDYLQVTQRRSRGTTAEFSGASRELARTLPRYYRRNFHFQTDGYLSRRSAEVYDAEVDLLFAGTTDALRRRIIAPFKQHFADRPTGGGLRFLEVGAGTGRATGFFADAFPQARITAIDLSEPYLEEARRNQGSHTGLNFMAGDAAELPFRDGYFDGIYSIFLFHELPETVRRQVLAEGKRCLKVGGLYGYVDSIQEDDVPLFAELLQAFSVHFHEPFYRNYIATPMRELLQEVFGQDVYSDDKLPQYTERCWITAKVGTARVL